MSFFLNAFHTRFNDNGSGEELTIKALLKNVRCNQNYNDAANDNVNFAHIL